MVLALCTLLLGSCIHPNEGDFRSTLTDPAPTEPTLETTPTVTAPKDTTPTETTPQGTVPPESTSSDQTTSDDVTDPEDITTPEDIIPPEDVTTTENVTTQPNQPPVPPTVEKIKIYIDQGHNLYIPTPPYWNTGAQGNGLDEAVVTYDLGIRLAALLEQDGRFEVRLSRPTVDTILGEYNGSVSEANDSALDFRVNDAAAWGADYFISLHINSYTDPSVRGLEVYAATADAEGNALGADILEGLIASTGLRSRGLKSGDHLRVLKNAQMPATLLEMGFISNLQDAELLKNSPDLFVQGIYNGIQSYFVNLEQETTAE